MLIRDAELEGRRTNLRLRTGRVADVAPDLAPEGDEPVVDAAGGAVIPGIHDHHVHLRAWAASLASVPVGPPAIRDAADLARMLRAAAGDGRDWVRAVGYHESVAGLLDAAGLDALVPDRPVRVQHRSGALWMLNTAALDATGAVHWPDAGLERDDRGRPTGRLWRLDHRLRKVVPSLPLDVAAVGDQAARAGITGFTDADPCRSEDDLDLLAPLPQSVHLMAPVGFGAPSGAGRTLGPVKVLLDDDDLPAPDDLADLVRRAHAEARPVAVHAVTRVQLIAAVLALQTGGAGEGDRIEHGAVIPDELVDPLRALRVTVVTQPAFVLDRGDQYLVDVEPDDRRVLYRAGSLLAAGVSLAAGSDAPFGHPDPWRAVAAAVQRRTESGVTLGPDERLDAPTALRLFLGHPARPGEARRITPGVPADICLLRCPLATALHRPRAENVRMTVAGGRVIYDADGL